MTEVDKRVTFNGLHICGIALTINLFNNIFINGDYDYIINLFNYVINIDTPRFWFIMIHIILTCLILFYIKFEVIVYASMKFNL